MTDEEKLAEEQIKRWDSILAPVMYPVALVKDFIRKSFLAGFKAGFKAGGTKWHRVADGDLPKEYTEVLQENGVKVILIGGHWRYVYGAKWEDDAIVYYWCEIPTYTEEEE